MLEAKKSVWFEKIFAIYNRNLFKRRFHSLHVSGLDVLQNRNKQLPLIIYANHSSWWDGFIAFQISRIAKLDSFLMMEEKQLQNLSLFRRLGAFSVVRENPRQAVESINYAAKILTERANRTLWIFPQGEILPNDIRPLRFFNGLARIIEKVGNCNVVPAAMRFDFLGEFKPEVFVKIGKAELFSADETFDSKKISTKFEEKLMKILDELKTDVKNKDFDKFKQI